MSRILYVPLDERPCNAKFPQQIAQASDLDLMSPPVSMLGAKKQPANTAALSQWILEQSTQTDVIIVSLDMLVYGGIVPSRLHHLTEDDCRARLATIVECKKKNPNLRIYAFNLIMRAPAYSSSDEEPDYYADHGTDLARNGWLQDKQARDGMNEAERLEFDALLSRLPEHVLQDFIERRRTNTAVNNMAIDLVKEGFIDFLIIPLDDNAKYGYSSSEQRQLLYVIEEKGLFDRVHLYPGADEIGCTLFARVFCEIKNYRPEIYTRFSSTSGPFAIPKYEDRSLGESLKCQITAAGGFIGDHAREADFVLMVNSPPVGQYEMAETTQLFRERHSSYFSEVNLREFAQAIRVYAEKGFMVALADVAVCNGSDEPLLKLLSGSGLLPKLSAYAGWNTSGNTLGTVIAHAIVESYYRTNDAVQKPDRSRNSEAFYLSRLVEDWGYQAIIRADIAANHLEELGGNYFDVASIHDQLAGLIHSKMEAFLAQYLQDFRLERLMLDNVILPWKRMFEVGFDLRVTAD
ncbi:hypothetical protein Back11_08010 [Paenibacillus baekrokdamisoli]|uniref:Uncharacterized protein n=1 Tax=Paenibacillus baekrokdamisoli TaxID=1712516 RepID=A0A3G9IMC3_9BACL|nr:DUF4127 family protein [Paenibacillus baekrokdamisoli]MBB3067358.1 hypothetical protein [Paenibacillus baekrokdamisoli]BBH19456.1 hypothetical protein Back11_08010 [Paenibacillus baekrokdamisoli]